jgi:hypothetical protein
MVVTPKILILCCLGIFSGQLEGLGRDRRLLVGGDRHSGGVEILMWLGMFLWSFRGALVPEKDS